MSALVLVRHSVPKMLPDVLDSQWPLSVLGRTLCAEAAEAVQPYEPAIIATSPMRRAVETASIIGKRLEVASRTVPGLEEHHRHNAGSLTGGQFQASIAAFFAEPDSLVFGEETGNQAYERFASTVQTIKQEYPYRNIAVVSHGTVISLFVARVAGIDAQSVWKSLTQPSVIVLDTDQQQLVRLVRFPTKG